MKNLTCPCCGYDFKHKNWVKESEILLRRYNSKTYLLLKSLFKQCGKYEKIFPEDVYKFLQGISTTEEAVVFEGLKSFFKRDHHLTKGIRYAQGMILNLEKNKEMIKERLQKTIGGQSIPLEE